MRRQLQRTGRLVLVALGVVLATDAVRAPVVAQVQSRAEVDRACAALDARFQRQNRIARAYRCALERGRNTARRRAFALKRCRLSDRARLRDAAEQRSAALERCVAGRLESGEATRAGVRTSVETDAERRARERAQERAKASGERIRELLAEGPRIDPAATGKGGAGVRRRTFHSGLMWSYAGPIAGMHCVQWREPSDPHKWDDNYLCTERDFGFQWSFRGPVLGRGLKCIQVNEKSDPHDWHDNYFCWPRDLAVSFRFSSTGRVPGMRCIAIVEPSDPHTWRDNYLCHEPAG